MIKIYKGFAISTITISLWIAAITQWKKVIPFEDIFYILRTYTSMKGKQICNVDKTYGI